MNDTFKEILTIPNEGKRFITWYNEVYGIEKLKVFQHALFEEQIGVYMKYLTLMYGNQFRNVAPENVIQMFKNEGIPF